MTNQQPTPPQEADPFSLERLTPALNFYNDNYRLTAAIYQCTQVPDRAVGELNRLRSTDPENPKISALSVLLDACNAGLVANIPDSPGLRRATDTDPTHTSLRTAQLTAQRGQEHLPQQIQAARAAVFLRAASEIVRRRKEARQAEELLATVPTQRQRGAPQVKMTA